MMFTKLAILTSLSCVSSFTPTAFAPRTVASISPKSTVVKTTKLYGEEYGASSTSFYTTTEKQVRGAKDGRSEATSVYYCNTITNKPSTRRFAPHLRSLLPPGLL